MQTLMLDALGSDPFGIILDKLHLLELVNAVLTTTGLQHKAAIGTYTVYAGIKNAVFIAESVVSLTAVKTLAIEPVHFKTLLGWEFHIADETVNNITQQSIAVIIPSGYVLE